MTDEPANFPQDIEHSTKEAKHDYIDSKLDLFVKKNVIQSGYDSNTSDDYVKNYGLMTIFLTVLLLQLKDTAAEGDGARNLINQKILLVVFRALNNKSKYATEMFVSIAQIECTLTPRLSEEFKWGFFVNWRGGEGNNIEDDLAQEIYNKLSKKIVKRLGANKSMKAISRICKATNGIKEVLNGFDKAAAINKGSSHHSSRESLDDEKDIIKDIYELAPFEYKKRAFRSFPEIQRAPHKYLDIIEFSKWIEDRKREWSVCEFSKCEFEQNE